MDYKCSFVYHHMHPDGLCETCSEQRESCIHMLRDCTRSRQIWLKLGGNESDIDSDQVMKDND